MYTLKHSTRKNKKYMVSNGSITIHFGAKGYEDYTTHKDPDRKKLYIARHKPGQDWTKSGINKAGFWSRWILWNKPNILDAIKATEKKFNISIKL